MSFLKQIEMDWRHWCLAIAVIASLVALLGWASLRPHQAATLSVVVPAGRDGVVEPDAPPSQQP